MGYVTSGEFEEQVREIFGPLKKKARKKKPIDFERFESELADELSALYTLLHTYNFPELAGLDWSNFVTIARQYGADAETLQEDYEVRDDESIALFLNSIEVFHNCGNPFFTVCDDGVCIAYDDPFEIRVWHHDFQGFLSFLVWVSAAANGHTPLDEVKEVFKEEFEIFDGQLFLDLAIESAQSHAVELASPGDETLEFDPTGLSFLFTGKLSSMTRAEAQKRVLKIGAKVAKSVNKNLDILVIGDDGSPLFGNGSKGTKHKKADTLIAGGASLKIISETDFLKL